MRTYVRFALLLATAAATLITGALTNASPGATERVSVDSAGNQANNASGGAAISADGRYVAFDSGASNLVPSDTNGAWDVFVHDRQTGATERVSVDSTGNQGNGPSSDLGLRTSISADGRYVAFYSLASNLVPDDTNGVVDIFVHDRSTGFTSRVSVDSAGNQSNGESRYPELSADGRYVAFHSSATNLVAGDTNGSSDVFVHDRQTGLTERVSVDSAGTQGSAQSYRPAISETGRYVAFGSDASNLVPSDTNGYPDVFVHDRQTSLTERVSVDTSENQGNNKSGDRWNPLAITADGRYVAFVSWASNLVPNDTNADTDVFVRDRQQGTTERVSVDSAGTQANWGSSVACLSSDGRYVAFYSSATNLVSGDTNGAPDVFVHDRQTGITERVSVDSNGNQGQGASNPAITPDGRYVAFEGGTGYVPNDTNGTNDVFIHDRGIPGSVGGIAELPGAAQGGSSAANYPALAGIAAAALLGLTAGAWYARRRWLR